MPAWTVDADVFSPDLLHRELQELVQAARWDDVAEFCRQMRYWLRFAEMPFSGFPWAARAWARRLFAELGRCPGRALRRGRPARPTAPPRRAGARSVH